jgi:hypothetical protein
MHDLVLFTTNYNILPTLAALSSSMGTTQVFLSNLKCYLNISLKLIPYQPFNQIPVVSQKVLPVVPLSGRLYTIVNLLRVPGKMAQFS